MAKVEGYRNSSWAFGEKFTVAAGYNLTIDALGVLDVGRDGFVTTDGLPVGIYSESSGTLLASTLVTSVDPLTGNYRFHSIAPITLLGGQSYRVVGVNLDDLYNIAYNPNLIVDPRVIWNGYAYGSSTTLQMLNIFYGMEISWFANFNIASSTRVPEVGCTFLILGLGMSGLAFLKRRLARK